MSDNMGRALPQPLLFEEFIRGMDGEDTIGNPLDWEDVSQRWRDGALETEEDEEADII